ncbi:MAG: hypothetical protein VX700_05305 [Pseudomonadota bacterium]|nr:hypothetical protein [Pseudomonadota bacterium]
MLDLLLCRKVGAEQIMVLRVDLTEACKITRIGSLTQRYMEFGRSVIISAINAYIVCPALDFARYI